MSDPLVQIHLILAAIATVVSMIGILLHYWEQRQNHLTPSLWVDWVIRVALALWVGCAVYGVVSLFILAGRFS